MSARRGGPISFRNLSGAALLMDCPPRRATLAVDEGLRRNQGHILIAAAHSAMSASMHSTGSPRRRGRARTRRRSGTLSFLSQATGRRPLVDSAPDPTKRARALILLCSSSETMLGQLDDDDANDLALALMLEELNVVVEERLAQIATARTKTCSAREEAGQGAGLTLAARSSASPAPVSRLENGWPLAWVSRHLGIADRDHRRPSTATSSAPRRSAKSRRSPVRSASQGA
jgi:hypothetical protein